MQHQLKLPCKKCMSSHVIFVEYPYNHPEYYDGVSEIVCQDCKARFGRWSGKELSEGEHELRSAPVGNRVL